MKYTRLIPLLIFLTACGVNPLNKKELILRVSTATFQVSGYQTLLGIPIAGGHGTGFYIAKDGKDYLMTAGHVCDHIIKKTSLDSRDISKENFIQANPSIARYSHDTDLCLLNFLPPAISPLPIADSISYPEEVAAVGYPYDNPLTVTFGYALHEYRDTLFPTYSTFITPDIFPGSSGGALVNMYGEVVGVISEGDKMTSKGNAVSLKNIHDFLRDL